MSGSGQTEGIRFERYTIHRLLDVGGMAEVYRASVMGPGGFEKPVVIKRVKPEYSTNDVFVQMFIDEARISATLDHANIVRVYDFGQSGKHYYLALEFIDGVDLRTLTEWHQERGQPRLGWQLSTVIMREVLAGLEHAHQQLGPDGQPLEIIHRDIDLGNIMIRRDGAVKVLDFGCAKAAKSIRRTETVVGTIKGKLSYMSPEQSWDEPLDARSDIFSASIVFHELLTGQKLFTANNPLEQLAAVRKQPIPDPRKLDSKVPRALSRIVLRGLERDRDKRYSSAQEMLEAVEDVIHKHRLKLTPLRTVMQQVMAERDAKTVDPVQERLRTSKVWGDDDTTEPPFDLAPTFAPDPAPPISHDDELDVETGVLTTKYNPSAMDQAPPIDDGAATVVTENPLWMLEEHVTTLETSAPRDMPEPEAPLLEHCFGPAGMADLETKILDTDPSAGAPSVEAPSAGAPSAGAPSVGAPSVEAPSAGAPSAGAPSVEAPRRVRPRARPTRPKLAPKPLSVVVPAGGRAEGGADCASPSPVEAEVTGSAPLVDLAGPIEVATAEDAFNAAAAESMPNPRQAAQHEATELVSPAHIAARSAPQSEPRSLGFKVLLVLAALSAVAVLVLVGLRFLGP